MEHDIFFSGSMPNLVSDKVIKKITKIFKDAESVTVTNHLSNFYDNYIKPNLFALLMFVTLALFLTVKYFVKKYKDEHGLIEETDDLLFLDSGTVDDSFDSNDSDSDLDIEGI